MKKAEIYQESEPELLKFWFLQEQIFSLSTHSYPLSLVVFYLIKITIVLYILYNSLCQNSDNFIFTSISALKIKVVQKENENIVLFKETVFLSNLI